MLRLLGASLGVAWLLVGCESWTSSSDDMVEPPQRTVNQAQLSLGKRVYETHCSKCHGKNGEGAPNWQIQGPDGTYPAPPLNGSGHTWHHPSAVLVSVIKNGSPGGMGKMPALGNKLSDQEVEAVIEWIKSLWPEEAYAAWYQQEHASNGHAGH